MAVAWFTIKKSVNVIKNHVAVAKESRATIVGPLQDSSEIHFEIGT